MPTFTDEEMPAIELAESDAIPPVSDVEYPCSICGAESGPYGGRGRKPTKCPVHKKSAATSTRVPRVTGSNDVLAKQATEALCQIDGMLSLGARVVGFSDTADAIDDADEVFRLRVYTALLNSPDTARKIVRMGSKAGDSALLIAIGLHITSILPVFMKESRAKREERAIRKLEESAE
jgi:hypothetical protein